MQSCARLREVPRAEDPRHIYALVNVEGSSFERLIGWTRLRSGPEVELVPELAHAAQHVIEKHQYGAFTPEFVGLLKERWMGLLLCGIATESCVLKTRC